MGNKKLRVQVTGLQRDIAGLLKLLGGDADQRLQFWEILKGITTPQVLRIVEGQLQATRQQINTATGMVKNLQANAKGLSS